MYRKINLKLLWALLGSLTFLLTAATSPTAVPTSFLNVYNYIFVAAGNVNTATVSSGTGGKATAANFVHPIGLFQDSMGLMYVSDATDFCIRAFNPTSDNIVKSVAGVCGSAAGDQQNVPATSASINSPLGMSGDTNGNLYFVEPPNGRVKKVNGAGILSLFAGTGGTVQDGNGGQATAASVAYANDVFMDSMGKAYLAMYFACQVRRIGADGIITLYAGVDTANSFTGNGGQATSATFNYVTRSRTDTTGVLYISDSGNNRVRCVSTTGIVTTLVGTGTTTYLGENLPPTAANIYNPISVNIGTSGDVYFSDTLQYRVYLITAASGLMNTYAGSGVAGSTGNGGTATSAKLQDARIVSLDTTGKLYISDYSNANVRVVYSIQPTTSPSIVPTLVPTVLPTLVPTVLPTVSPTLVPSILPTVSSAPTSARSTQNVIQTVAGTGTSTSTGTSGFATAAAINQARSVTQDTAGATYWTEHSGHCVRKFGTNNIVVAVSGVCGTSGFAGDNGKATSALMNIALGAGFDTLGNLFVADYSNKRVRAVSTGGIITTVCGTGTTGATGDGFAASSALLSGPHGLWVNSVGTIYVTMYDGHAVRKFTNGGLITLVAGTGTSGYSGEGGAATAALVSGPERLTGDTVDTLYLSDSNNSRMRMISVSTNIINLYAGTGATSYGGNGVVATSCGLYTVSQTMIEPNNGDVYISGRLLQMVFVITKTTGKVTTFAGTGASSSTGDGGAATSATMKYNDGIYLNSMGLLYVAEYLGSRVRVIFDATPTVSPTVQPTFTVTATPTVSYVPTGSPSSARSTSNSIKTLGGTGTATSTGTGGFATAATFNAPRSIVLDSAGIIYFTEHSGSCVRKIGTDGIVGAVSGQCGTSTYAGDNGKATSSYMNTVIGASLDTSSNLIVGDYNNHRFRMITPSGIITTVCGTGTSGAAGIGGPASSAQVYGAHGVWVNSVSTVYVTSYNNHMVRMFTVGGTLTAVAGTGTASMTGNGFAATAATLNSPERVGGDTTNVIYISDSQNSLVRVVSLSNIISTFAGTGGTTYGGNNLPATSCGLYTVSGSLVDPDNGDVYVSARVLSRLVVITRTTGLVTTFAGTGTGSSTGDGLAATSATMNNNDGLFLDTLSQLYAAEFVGNKLRMIYEALPSYSPTVVPTTISPTVIPTMLPTVMPSVSYAPSHVRSSQNSIFLVAGTGTLSSTGTGGLATAATLNDVRSLWGDSADTLYWSEAGAFCVRKMSTSTNIVQTHAGVCGTSGSTPTGAATSAKMNIPYGIGGNTAGVTYITDQNLYLVRMVSSSGITSIYGGTGTNANNGNGGQATSAAINVPFGAWVNSVGTLYVTEYQGYMMRAIAVSGIISTAAGTGSSGNTGDGFAATSATLSTERVFGLSTGLLYVSDPDNNRIRVISDSGIINAFAGAGSSAYNGENLAPTSTNLNVPNGIAVDTSNYDMYISDRNNMRLRVITQTTGLVTTFAGTGANGNTGNGFAATSCTLKPEMLFMDTTLRLYVSEYSYNDIRVIYSVTPTSSPTAPTCSPTTAMPSVSFNPSIQPSFVPTQLPSTVRSTLNNVFLVAGAGTASSTGTGGFATAANINVPRSVWGDSVGTLYWVESTGYCVRKISTSANIVQSHAGVCGTQGSTLASTPATSAKFNNPIGVVGDTSGGTYITDQTVNSVLKVSSPGSTASVYGGAGTASNTGNGGPATSANINAPFGNWMDSMSTLYITEISGFMMRAISSSGIISTVAGTGVSSYTGDGGPATSATLATERVFGLSTGVVYVSDPIYYRIRQITTAGIIKTYAGTGTSAYNGENLAPTSSNLNIPSGMAVDTSNFDFYIGDRDNFRIRVVTQTTGLVTTFAGTGVAGNGGNGAAATSCTLRPEVLFLDTTSRLYFNDQNYNDVRVIYSVTPTASPTVSFTPTCLPTTALPSVSFTPSILPSVVPTQLPTAVRSSQNSVFLVVGAGAASSTGTGGYATAANINGPRSVWEDSVGTLYWVEGNGYCVRKISTSTNIVQGHTGVCGTSGSTTVSTPATSAKFSGPIGVVGDTSGGTYVTDYVTNYVIKVSSSGSTASVYGGNGGSSVGNGVAATSTGIFDAFGNWMDTMSTLYVTQISTYIMRAISSSGIITTFAGTGTNSFSGDGGPATSATLATERVFGLTTGVVYVSDPSYFRIRQISPSGIISTYAGTGTSTYNGENMAATSTNFKLASGMAVDTSNYDFYISDRDNFRLRVITKTTGLVSTFAGTGTTGNGGNGGAATSCTLAPEVLFMDTTSRLYFNDGGYNDVRVIYSVTPTSSPTFSFVPTCLPTTAVPSVSFTPTVLPSVVPTQLPSTVRSTQNSIFLVAGAGAASSTGTGGFATSANLYSVRSVWGNSVGTLYWVENGGYCARKINTNVNIVQSHAGVCGSQGSTSVSTAATSAKFNGPIGFVGDTSGGTYITDQTIAIVVKVSSTSTASVYGGTFSAANNGNGGQATSAAISNPFGLWMDSLSTLYITEVSGYMMRAISSSGIISTYAGTGTNSYSGDGGPATSATLATERVFGLSTGAVYVSDPINYRVRQISPSGIISTIAGSISYAYNGENLAPTSSYLNVPSGMAVDTSNFDFYISDRDNYRIRVITQTTGLMSTFAGSGIAGNGGNGAAATSCTLRSEELFMDTTSRLYLQDISYNDVRVIYSVTPTASPTVSFVPTCLPTTAVPSVSFTPTMLPSVVPTQLPSTVRGTLNSIFLVAGAGTATSTGTGGFATAANLNSPRAVWANSVGTLYWTENGGYCARKISVGVNIVQSHAGVCGSTGTTTTATAATSAKFNSPVGVAGDTSGVTYLNDYGANIVFKISGTALTVYGGTTGGANAGNGGAATSATILSPFGNWVDSVSTLYITELGGYMMRAISASGIISTYAGTGTNSYTGDGGPATSATLATERVFGVSTGVVYVSDPTYGRIRQITLAGIISTIAGTGTTAYNGENVAPTSANFNIPSGMAVDTSNFDMYISDRNNYRLRVWTKTTGLITTYGGSGSQSNGGNGGAATSCTLEVESLHLDTTGRLYMNEYPFNDVRVIYSVAPSPAPSFAPSGPSPNPTFAPTALPTTTAPSAIPTTARGTQNNVFLAVGTGASSSTGNGGKATSASAYNPRSVWQDTAENIYFAEIDSHCIRKYSTITNIVSAVGGTCGTSGYSGDNGPATSATFKSPAAMQVDTTSVLYWADLDNYRVRKISTAGIVTLYAGTGSSGNTGDNGQATAANLNRPHGLCLNSAGLMYITIFDSHLVKSISASGILTWLAGTGSSGFSGDGGQATAAPLYHPERIVVSTTGLIYVSDSYNDRVRTLNAANIINTVVGSGVSGYSGEGQAATSSAVNYPTGTGLDTSNGDLYVATRDACRIQVMTGSSSLVTTYAGTGSCGSTGDGGAATSAKMVADGMFLDTTGRLYFGDYGNSKVRVIYSVSPTSSPTVIPTVTPSIGPSLLPTLSPSVVPSTLPSILPTIGPTYTSTISPSVLPTVAPSEPPSVLPSVSPTCAPTIPPTSNPTAKPTIVPSCAPSVLPSLLPTVSPSMKDIPISHSPSFKAINAFAFAGITSSGGVQSWGAACCGGDSSSVNSLVKTQVKQVVQSKNAFAALKSSGSVIAWGSGDDIAGSTEFRGYTTIVSLMATERAFAGVTNGGGVIAFGADCCGGNVDQYGWAQYLTSDVSSVVASAGAFCALKTDGTVYCWGSKFAGGGVSSLTRSDLKNIVFLTSTRSAFAGMTSDGSVVVWGNSAFGGAMSSVIETKLNQNTQYIVSGGLAFVASTSSGGLVAWGSASDGGDSSSVVGVFTYVAHTASAFAGVRSNGTLTSWGNSRQGGDSSSVAASLSSVSVVVGNTGAFAAITSAGNVIAWGESESGGRLFANVSSTIGSGVTTIYHTSKAFAVLNTAGAVTAWGKHNMGGSIDSSIAAALSSEVKLICANDNGFTAIKTDGTAYGWGSASCLVSGSLAGDYSTVSTC